MRIYRDYRLPVLCIVIVSLLFLTCGGDKSSGPAPGPNPELLSFSPSTGTVGTEFTITGLNFRSQAVVWFNTLLADSVEVLGGVELRGFVPAGIDTGVVYTVTVRNIDGTAADFDSAFTPIPPVLNYVNSATRPYGIIGSTVILEGDAFGDLQGEGNVFFSDGSGGTVAATILSNDDWTNTFVVTTVPSGAETGAVTVETATGTSHALTFHVTQNATFSPSAIDWTETTSLPNPLSGHSALFVPIGEDESSVEVACVIGGIDDQDSVKSDIFVATIQSDGHLSDWVSTAPLTEPRTFHAAVAATPRNSKTDGDGYIYVLGGIHSIASGPVNTVYRGRLTEDGQISSWEPALSLPVAMHSCEAAVFRSSIYVAGGSTAGNQPVHSVYRASIDSLGMLDVWEPAVSLPAAVSYHGLTSFGGYLHILGGDIGTVDPNDADYNNNESKVDEVLYMKIDLRTGDLATSAWSTNSSALVKVVSKHTVVAAGGYAFVSGGLYNGAGNGSSENKYAQFNSDGSLSSFHGATGSNTISSLGGGNLFNHAAITYVDANGVAHVMVIGGDDVNNPGARHSGVWFY